MKIVVHDPVTVAGTEEEKAAAQALREALRERLGTSGNGPGFRIVLREDGSFTDPERFPEGAE